MEASVFTRIIENIFFNTFWCFEHIFLCSQCHSFYLVSDWHTVNCYRFTKMEMFSKKRFKSCLLRLLRQMFDTEGLNLYKCNIRKTQPFEFWALLCDCLTVCCHVRCPFGNVCYVHLNVRKLKWFLLEHHVLSSCCDVCCDQLCWIHNNLPPHVQFVTGGIVTWINWPSGNNTTMCFEFPKMDR